jgi:MYXO-CTERM domain-containing protein
MIRLVLISAVIAGGVAAGARRADACTCLPQTEAEQLEAHDIVFEGTAATVEPGGDEMERATFRIDEVIKGAADDKTVIEYGTSTAGCGLGHLEVGTRMRMYVQTMNDGALQAGLCGGSRRLDLPPVPTGDPTGSPADNPLPPAPHKRGCGACASGGGEDGGNLAWLPGSILVGALLLRRRRT